MTMLPKPDAYFVKSMFSDEPLVHIAIIEKAGTDTQWNGINVATQRLSETGTETRASSSHSIPIRMLMRWNCCSMAGAWE